MEGIGDRERMWEGGWWKGESGRGGKGMGMVGGESGGNNLFFFFFLSTNSIKIGKWYMWKGERRQWEKEERDVTEREEESGWGREGGGMGSRDALSAITLYCFRFLAALVCGSRGRHGRPCYARRFFLSLELLLHSFMLYLSLLLFFFCFFFQRAYVLGAFVRY